MRENGSDRYERKRNDQKTVATEKKWNRIFMQFITGVWSVVVAAFLWATYVGELCGPVKGITFFNLKIFTP